MNRNLRIATDKYQNERRRALNEAYEVLPDYLINKEDKQINEFQFC